MTDARRPPCAKLVRGGLLSAGLALGLALSADAAMAQSPPVQLPPIVDPAAQQRQSLERQKELLEKAAPPPAGQGGVDTSRVQPPAVEKLPELSFHLVKVAFSPSQVLSQAELDAVAADYIGRTVSFADLQQMVVRINALYKKHGSVASEAVIEPQDVTEGVVRVRLVEGRVGKLRLQSAPSVNDSYVLARVRARPGDLVNLPSLERDLNWFNHESGEARLRAELLPGEEFGTTDIALAVAAPPRHSLLVYSDDAGSPTTGTVRAGLAYTNRSLLGRTDELNASATYAEGFKGINLGYDVPVSTWGTRLSLSGARDLTRIVNGPFVGLHLTGDSDVATLGLRQPLWVGADSFVDARVNTQAVQAHTYASGHLLQTSDSHDRSGGLAFGRNDSIASFTGSWSGDFTAVWGHPIGPGGRNFRLIRENLRRDQQLPLDLLGRLIYSRQYTGAPVLPSVEQFFIGGVGSVRGYSNQAFFGNSGSFINAELHHDLPKAAIDHYVSALSGFAFFDWGNATPVGPGLRSTKLSSMGAGAEASLFKGVFARLTLARPLMDKRGDNHRPRVDFSLTAQVL